MVPTRQRLLPLPPPVSPVLPIKVGLLSRPQSRCRLPHTRPHTRATTVHLVRYFLLSCLLQVLIASLVTAPTPTSQPIDHKISVGAGGLVFSPSNISASIGDTVTFEFETPKTNHTATQSSFSHPCQPLADTSTTGQVGFDAGLFVAFFILLRKEY